MARWYITLFIAITSVLMVVSPSLAEDFLGLQLRRMDVDGGESSYGTIFVANKDGATTATLTTPLGIYPCMDYGSHWLPDMSGPYWPDHTLSWSDFSSVITGNWILIWDEGLATETVANIGFGPIQDSDFPPQPVISYPIDGVAYPEGVSLVEWNYGLSDPCVVPTAEVWVNVHETGVGGWNDDIFGPLSCDVTSVHLTIPSFATQHTVIVTHFNNLRTTAEGIGGLVTGDPWILEGEYWLGAHTSSQLEFSGQVVNTVDVIFGSLKAMYR